MYAIGYIVYFCNIEEDVAVIHTEITPGDILAVF